MNKRNIFQYITLVTILTVLVISLASCGDDSVNTTSNNNNNGGQNTTPIGNPIGVPVTASIGTSGGSIISSDSTFQIIIPPGALGSNTDITIQPVENYCFNGHGDGFRLQPDGLQFSQPVRLKFRYTADILGSTLGMLMGIARQNASGKWHCINDITNDTISMTITANVTGFGSANDNIGGGDFSFFDIAHIEPPNSLVRVNQVLNLTVTYAAVPGGDDGDELTYLPRPINSWSVNGITNGNPAIGTISGTQGQSGAYHAPANVPNPPTVLAGALVNTEVNYRGQVIGVTLLQAPVKILSDTAVYDLRVDMFIHDYQFGIIEYHCDYSDGITAVIRVSGGNLPGVVITDIVNRMPLVTPPSGHYPNGQGSITWVPEGDSGHINVTAMSGNIFNNTISLGFTNRNIKYAKFHCVPPQGEAYDIGGYASVPFLSALQFPVSNEVQIVSLPNVGITATLTPRQ